VSKEKLQLPKRNPLVVAVMIKTGAGNHRKSNKALRQKIKQRDNKIFFERPSNNVVACL
jgi:hypothetical protein